MILFIFIRESVYFLLCCCSIINTMISLVVQTTLNSHEQPEEIYDSIK